MNAWILAFRPKTLTASFVPIFVATMLALKTAGQVDWIISICALLAAVLIQMGTNLVNDAIDYQKGADTSERLGPMRVTQSGLLTGTEVLAAGIFCFVAAFFAGIPLIISGGTFFAFLLVISGALGYLYTGGPYPLAYKGLGDLFVLLFFGLVATCAVYYLQVGAISTGSMIAGAQIGLLATVMIAINNLRDVEGDARVNKRTVPVRFGADFAKKEIICLILAPFLLNLFWIISGRVYAGFMPFFLVPLAMKIVQGVLFNPPGKIYNKFLGMAALLQILFGLFLGIGFLFG